MAAGPQQTATDAAEGHDVAPLDPFAQRPRLDADEPRGLSGVDERLVVHHAPPVHKTARVDERGLGASGEIIVGTSGSVVLWTLLPPVDRRASTF